MNLFGLMDTSGSAMQAERMRAEVVAANMANTETTRTADGGTYHRQMVVFAANGGDSQLGGSFADSMNGAFDGSISMPQMPQIPQIGLGAEDDEPAGGVHIAEVTEDPAAPLKRYDPGHPDADAEGYVSYPNINPATEMVDLMGATRAYGLNGSAVQAEKGMITSALDIVKA
jgi:flagellar basal-body rod protein FlgC